ncbi:MAG: DMT family transporter [Oscillospiraceae bacterium]|nr:DMT family transporter [Oscillospiraceae bacterium]
MKKQLQGSLLLVLATLIWGSTFVAQSTGMDHIGPFTFLAIRNVMGAVFLFALSFLTDRFLNDGKTSRERWMDPKLWKAALLCGTPLFVAAALQQMGIVSTDPGKSGFLTAMYIVFVPIFGIFLKRKPSKWIPVSVVLGVIGLYFLSCVGVTSISVSDLLLIGCAVVYAIQILCVDLFGLELDSVRLNCLCCTITCILATIVTVFMETPTWAAVNGCWGPLLYAGILSSGIAFTLQMAGQKHVEPSTASLLMSLESVFAVLSGWVVLGDLLSTYEAIGCILIFIAILLSQIPEKKKEKSKV